jgi:uncharacterized lipoprotein YmbA
MSSELVFQVISTFFSAPSEPSFGPVLSRAGIAEELRFVQLPETSEYLHASSFDGEEFCGGLILVRVEDWLRPVPEEMKPDAWARQILRAKVDEFVNQVEALASRGKPLWLLACPSQGWLAQQYNLATLCRTYTNLLETRVKEKVTVLRWPAFLTGDGVLDPQSDQSHQTPYTQKGFAELGTYLGEQIASAMAKKNAAPVAAGPSPQLATYLAGLQVRVRLAKAQPGEREHVDRILRSTASFTLTGEKRDLTEAEVEQMLASECLLVYVSDRLADYGASGLAAYKITDDTLEVDALALSCTVLGKQVEYAVLSALCELAAQRSREKVVMRFQQAPRNQPMLAFLNNTAKR